MGFGLLLGRKAKLTGLVLGCVIDPTEGPRSRVVR